MLRQHIWCSAACASIRTTIGQTSTDAAVAAAASIIALACGSNTDAPTTTTLDESALAQVGLNEPRAIRPMGSVLSQKTSGASICGEGVDIERERNNDQPMN